MAKKGRRALWEEYYKRGIKYRKRFTKRALNHKNHDYEDLITYTKNIRRNVNDRLKALEKAGLDYGKPYNNLQYYLDVEWETNRFPTLSQIKENREKIRDLNEQALKLLRSPLSTGSGMIESNDNRINVLKNYDVLPKYVYDEEGEIMREASYKDYRDYDDFLRFLGTEEVSTAIEGYGTSEQVVDMLWNYWTTVGDYGENKDNIYLMKRTLASYNAGLVNFDEAMKRVGIKIEDYIS